MLLTKQHTEVLKAIIARKNNFFNFSINEKEYFFTDRMILNQVTKDRVEEVLEIDGEEVNTNNLEALKDFKDLLDKMESLEMVGIIIRKGYEVEEVDVLIDFSKRKNLSNQVFYEDETTYFCNRWEREDGMVDKYKDIYQEAMTNGFN